MDLKIKKMCIENFKGIKHLSIDFGNKTIVLGQNATGKTTIMDSFTWLLFNKDGQGKSDFNIRPNDPSGKRVDNVVIKVSATLEFDGKEILVTKTQEQNWVKKRGSDVPEFQGNVNSYEINEIPKSEKDYKAYIENLINEELFKLITSPQAFTALKWKEQRETLLKLVSEVTDQDVIATDVKFDSLMELLESASVEDLTAKTKKALKELNKKQLELPARIDEASKGLVQVDFTEHETRRARLEEQIRDVENQETDAANAGEAMEQIQTLIIQKQFDLGELKRQINEGLVNRKRQIQKCMDDAEREFSSVLREQGMIETQIKEAEGVSESNRIYRETLLEKHKEIQSMQMNPGDLCCPMCGQELPPDQSDLKIAEFQSNKQKNLDEIVKNGTQAAANITAQKKRIEDLNEKLEMIKTEKIKQNGLKTAFIEELKALPDQVNPSDNPDYQRLLKEISEIESRAHEMTTGSGYRNQLRQKKAELVMELDCVKSVLTGRENNQRVQERIVELHQEQRTVSQQIANQEKGLFLLEDFTKTKMEMLSSMINSKFKIVNFRLFENQINGGYKETCECMVKGVPFGSLNTGHRVVAGLDIISALQGIYNVTAPIFIDNAESVNDFNIPDMSGQLILLKVSTGDELKVEV